jgi:hypothetical protein
MQQAQVTSECDAAASGKRQAGAGDRHGGGDRSPGRCDGVLEDLQGWRLLGPGDPATLVYRRRPSGPSGSSAEDAPIRPGAASAPGAAAEIVGRGVAASPDRQLAG